MNATPTEIKLEPVPDWPLTVNFKRENFAITFDTAEEVRRWTAHEFGTWNSFSTGVAGNNAILLVQNRDRLTAIQQASDAGALIEKLRQVAEDYWPSAGPLGTMMRRISSPVQRGTLFFEVTNPGALQPFQNNPDYVSAKSYVAIYNTLRDDIGALEKAVRTNADAEENVREITLIKNSYEEEFVRFRALVDKCEVDWRDKIESFVQKQALEAPKAYWQERAAEYASIAKGDRQIWLLAIVVVSLGVAAFLWFVLDHAVADNIVVELTRSIQKIVIFGTLLGFAVWWLRQKLRDLRTHAHLASDAAERVTMIQTFAAMRAAGLQDANLEPILAALYRPAVGASIDDGGPVLPLEILLKSMGEALKK